MLTLVSMILIDRAIFAAATLIRKIATNRSFEKAFAA
jgi:hypothetical protein